MTISQMWRSGVGCRPWFISSMTTMAKFTLEADKTRLYW